ncbi:Ionotropic receptor 85a, partial [Carabus blaptoides fortunei]
MAAVTVLLVLIVSGATYANITLLDYNTDNISELLEFATGAYHLYCKYCRATLIVHDEDEIISNYFFEMLTHYDFNMSIISLSLSGQESTCELNGKFAGTIIELTIVFWTERYYNKPDYFLDSMEKSPYWNRFSKMIIIVTGNIPTDYIGWLEYTFKTFWKRKILRVFICFWMHGHMHVYMYNPFIEHFAKNISDATTEQYVSYIEYELLDLYGYPLKAFIYDIYPYSQRVEYGRADIFDRITYTGLDGHFITEVRNILNVTLHLRRESNGMFLNKFRTKNPNKTVAITIQNFLQTHDLDIWFTAMSARRQSNANLLFLHERDDLCIVVPTGAAIPQYWYIFLVIPVEMWIGIVTSLLLVALFLHLLHRPTAILDTYRIITNVPLVDPAQPVDLPERTVLATWIVFALITTAVFQCTLTSTL